MSRRKFDIKTRLRQAWQKIRGIHPLLLALIVFVISIVLPSEYSIWNQVKLYKQIKVLEKEKKEIIEQIRTDRKSLETLNTDKRTLEKFARENFLMKEENEDIYLIDPK